MATPQWNARHNGVLGDASAFQDAGDVNQFLGTHGVQAVYQGTSILTPAGTGVNQWNLDLLNADIDQPFTLSGTSIGRVSIPVLPVGNGADLLVSLCTNSGGIPGTVLQQTRIPASWITQLGAANGLDAAGSLSTAQQNVLLFSNWQTIPWSVPSTGPLGGLSTAQVVQSNGYFVFAGGIDSSNQGTLTTVVVIPWAGGTTVGSTSLGPSLPQSLLFGGLTVTSDTLCYAGGVTATGTFPSQTWTVQSTVYLASWDAPTGTIGAWSVQQPLPHPLVDLGIASYSPTDTVYVVGGSLNYASATEPVNTVYYTTIASQQITAWLSAPPLPISVINPTVSVVGNWLVVTGGFNSNSIGYTSLYYAPINPSTGVPGQWVQGPSIPAGLDLYVEANTCATDTAIVWPQSLDISTSIGTYDTLTLTFDEYGPSNWVHQFGLTSVAGANDQNAVLVETDTNGIYQLFNFINDDSYYSATVLSVPMVSVPIPTTGLTNNTTYHVLIQQLGGDINNYLLTLTGAAIFSGSPTALTSPKLGYSWSSTGPSGTAVPIQIFNNAVPTADALPTPLHTWEDNGARITTLINSTTPDGAFIGICEATSELTAANANTGFQNGLTPWTVTGGSFAQSTTQVFDGAYSCQITPSGSASSVFITSEILDCLPGQQIYVWAPVWFTSAVTSNYSLSVVWLTTGNVPISTSSDLISVPAATWTQTSNTFTAVSLSSFAYRYQIQITLSGTPSASQVWYVGAGLGGPLYAGNMNSSVTQVNYAESSYPLINAAKPTGLTRLA